MFQAVKLMIYDETLRLYDYPTPTRGEGETEGVDVPKHSDPIEELLTLKSKQVSKNIVVVEAPQKAGAHDDFSDALVRSVWLSILEMGSEKYATLGYAQTTPYQSRGSSLSSFQAIKARQHGANPRRVPRVGVRGMSRYVR